LSRRRGGVTVIDCQPSVSNAARLGCGGGGASGVAGARHSGGAQVRGSVAHRSRLSRLDDDSGTLPRCGAAAR